MREHPLICALSIALSRMVAPAQDDVYAYPAWSRDEQSFKAQTVYFGSGGSAADMKAKLKVRQVANYLNANPSAAVEICGHTDDRGSEERNRRLGGSRAEALRKEMISAGVNRDRIDIISYGEDRPAAKGRSAEARTMNRRAEFVLLTPPTRGCERITSRSTE